MGKATAVDSVNVNSTLHPPYFEMISDAILTLKDRSGSSQQAITKLIEEKYEKSLPLNFKKTLSVQLKKFVKSERLIKVKNSFKISRAEKQKLGGANDSRKKAVTGRKETEDKKNPETGGRKTKRLSQVKTPEGKKISGEKKKKKAAVNLMGGKTKRLSQVKTPEGLKKKKKNGPTPTPMKRKILNMGKSRTGPGREKTTCNR